jgi:acyl-CoA thioesterase FadM
MALEHRIVHIEEVRAATVLHIESDLLELGDTHVRCMHRMHDSESQRALSAMEISFVLIGSDEGSVTALPPDLVRRAFAMFPRLPRRSAAQAEPPDRDAMVLPA